MTTSRSDQPGEKRPFAVVPVRAVKDRRLKISDLRLLVAIGYYANRAGVCWPSMKTLSGDTGIDPSDIAKMVPGLVTLGYLRQLNPNDYDQKKGVWGHSNRYQLLWRGDEPVPTWEQVKDANLLQPEDVREPIEGSGARGTVVQISNHATQLAAAWAAALERETGVRPAQQPPVAELAALADAGVPPGALAAEAATLTRERARARLGPPSFALISQRLLAVYRGQTVG